MAAARISVRVMLHVFNPLWCMRPGAAAGSGGPAVNFHAALGAVQDRADHLVGDARLQLVPRPLGKGRISRRATPHRGRAQYLHRRPQSFISSACSVASIPYTRTRCVAEPKKELAWAAGVSW